MGEEFEFIEQYHSDKSSEGSFTRILNKIKKEINVQYACKIIKVISQHVVDLEYYDNGVADVLYNVPVKHYCSSTGFFVITLKVGDRGILRPFDNDIDGYRAGIIAKSSETRTHDLNDSLFNLGFYPDSENYDFPSGDVVIGNNKGDLIVLNSGEITISCTTANINATNINLGIGGQPIARVGDEVQVDPVTHKGLITTGSEANTSA